MRTANLEFNEVTIMKLEAFIEANSDDMCVILADTVAELQATMAGDPDEYTDTYSGDDAGPSIDVRLCIDLTRNGGTWIFRTGLVDFDPRHSQYCAASSVGLDTDPEELLAELISQLD